MMEEAQKLADRIYVLLQGTPWPVAQLAISMSALQYEANEERRKKAAKQQDE